MPFWYVYVLYEHPSAESYFVKIGYTSNPIRRLKLLQAGNPRVLRTPQFSRMPTEPFGYPLPTRKSAVALERAVHLRLRQDGHGLMSDLDYDRRYAYQREWYSHIHPDDAWAVVLEEASRLKSP
jgi:hypothetical protein